MNQQQVNQQLAGKTAIITGGASGIGAAISMTFAVHGATVHILEIGAAEATRQVDEIVAAGGKATAHVCDVGDQAAVTTVINTIAAQSGIDILVNNAGVAHVGNAINTSEADLDRLYRVNIKGVYNCLHAALPHMQQHGGAVLNMASIAATVGLSDRFAYSMTKGAVLAMTYSVAKDYLANNIRCNSLSPARIHTPFVDGFIAKNYPGREAEMFDKLAKTQPIGRMGTPEEVAELALFLCSDKAAFITGSNYPIDGGFITLNG